MELSLVISTRNNLKYLKWSYESIKKHQGKHKIYICYGLDNCTDGTNEWVEELAKTDPYVSFISNDGPGRLGHTIMYDKIIWELVKTDYAMIFHSDMYLCPNAIDYIEKYIDRDTIVSLTRIEPPLHPNGPEKLVRNFGTEPENFDERSLLNYVSSLSVKSLPEKTTKGIFAPWAFHVETFKWLDGHDPLFRPQSKEDSDLFNRYALVKTKFIQTWRGLVYHLTCRGSRFNPNLTEIGKNSNEWTIQNKKSERNFIRKWGSNVMHNEYLNPIVPPRFKTLFEIKNCSMELLHLLEPFCDYLDVDLTRSDIEDVYVSTEQLNTDYNLHSKFIFNDWIKNENDINKVIIDGKTFTQEDFSAINVLPFLIDEYEHGVYNVGNLTIVISKCKENINSELIFVKTGINKNNWQLKILNNGKYIERIN